MIATFFSLASSCSAAIFIAAIAASRLPSAKVSHAAAASFEIRVWPAQYSSFAAISFASISSRCPISARAAARSPYAGAVRAADHLR